MAYLSLNPLAVLVAAALAFGLGALWYSVLFGNLWMRLHGHATKSEAEQAAMKAAAPRAYAVSFVCFLVMACALTALADYIALHTVNHALKLAVLVFVGFVGPLGLVANMYSDRPLGAWVLDAGYQALYLVLMSLVVVLWL
jgi:cytochrome bd-type quinol oxidase subunit 2